ncbi:sensor histidine kinase [Nocardioides caldifontis]|uniref:sensor histidine kinase n=1 Tax=Nocardioides caldifontis TaxID=2588938 RepID=UPI0011DFA253|nr:histidine kinase [Nocardioides caldifontis]
MTSALSLPSPHRDGLPRVATAVAVVAWGLALVSTVLLLAARPPLSEDLLFFLVDVTVATVYGTVAAVVLARRRHVVPAVLGIAAVGGGLAGLGAAYEQLSWARGGLPLEEEIGRLQGTAWMPGTLALFLVVPWLVRDHPLRWWSWAGVAAGVAVTTTFTVAAGFQLVDDIRGLTALAMVVGSAAAAEVEWRHRRGPVAERNGLGWLAVGSLGIALSFAPFLFPFDAMPVPYWFTPVVQLATQAVYPAAVLTAVLRGRMWDLGLAVSRATLAGLLTVGLLALYLVVVPLVSALMPDGAAALVGAGVVAVAVQPARLWLGRLVERLVYGAAADPARLVRRIGSNLRTDDPDLLLEGLVADLGRAMRLESVRLEAPPLAEVVWGSPTSAPRSVPLLHRGTTVGGLEVTLPAGEALGTRDEATLRDLSAVLATAVAVTLAGHEVAAARDRLSRARLEERRLIRREIHDGLGPSLAGLRLGLQGVRNLLATDPAAAEQLLGALQEELDQRVDEVRSLSHQLLPPVLDELGLDAALTELATRYAEEGVEVSVTSEGVETVDPALAGAAYGIATEAVVNVVRHSGASRCWVDARVVDEALVLTVADDGRGVPADARGGVGTHSMRERAEEQGGRVERLPREGGGTVVRATLPVGVVARG